MDIFTALKKVFSTGLIVSDVKNDSIKIIDTQRSQAYSKKNTFFSKLHRNQYYQSTLAQNYSINRLALYRDYDMMDADPILSSALDIYTFQALTKDEYGDILKIKSNDAQIEQTLRELFYQRLSCQFNLSVWFRSFVKYGDFFLALRLDDELGIIGSQPISAYDMERVQDDERNPDTYYFRFVAGNDKLIDNYNIAHFRLLKDPNFLPYGRSVLEPARRIWKNFSLMVDAMMIQRIMRAPERRVFKVDVGDLDNQEVGPFMNDVIQKMKKVPYKDSQTGEVNLKYNIQNLLEDFFIPVRGKQDGSSIETLAGMQNNMIQDINFIKSYMMAALKIPKAFLTFEQGIESKATLASLDIIFARLIEDLQNLFLSQLYRVALIHLFILGYTDVNNIDFKLEFSNPSSVKKIQEIELWNQKVDLGTKMQQSKQFSLQFIFKNIYDISIEQAKQILVQVAEDTKFRSQLASIEQGGGQESEMQPANQEQPEEAPGQLEQQANEQNNWDTQYQPLTNNFQGNTPLNLDK